ncbi:DUF3993 domain-containing protein [Bacillus sp. 31A1R]|uniref:DUF3993 domain-containing protein n=1 Tax=Robertmurraya mangrovi TaxID=3098077 RepID=A0ABU5ITW3_9BACI|nr:DUF3993 domain-containing protein [Bacillus sp. 31A1R]MDZ5470600.1 DUF3993 domain-containing protein [Bacillus sp. 31A1R]
MRHPLLMIVFTFVIILIFPVQLMAAPKLEAKEDVMLFLEEAFHAQVALSEEERTLKEVKGILSPYFSKNYEKMFLNENLVKMNGKYIIFGSDFALYYVPFFSDEAQVVFKEKEIYVFEFFPANEEGPVTYKDHYEGLLLTKVKDKWKITKYLYDNIPEDILMAEDVSNTEIENVTTSVENLNLTTINLPVMPLTICTNPVFTFYQYAMLPIGDSNNSIYAFLKQNQYAKSL